MRCTNAYATQVLGDVVESLIGAIFVDSQYNLQTVFASLDRIYANILPLINIENVIRDPHSNLVMYGQSIGCSQLKIKFVLFLRDSGVLLISH